MADRPRGRGRGRGPLRGRGGQSRDANRQNEHRDVPWKLLLGFRRLQELKDKEPYEVTLTLSKRKHAFKEALSEATHENNIVALFLRCIAKASECETLRESMIEIFVILENSLFFKSSLPAYIFSAMTEASHDRQMNYKQPFRDILTIVRDFRLKMPQSIVSVMGLNAILDTTFNSLRNNVSEVVDDEMWESYLEYKEGQEESLKRMATKKTKTRQEVDNEEDPPDDFRELTIFPGKVDVEINAEPFIRRNKKTGGYENTDHYLDVQFRLLREDFIGPLRDGIKEYIEAVHATGKAKRLQELRIYTDVQIISPVCNNSGLCRRISFHCKGMDRIRWESSKRLIYGSLVCLSSDNFQTLLFATVADRDLKNIQKGLVDVKFETDNRTIANIPEDTVFVMAETTAYFEAYRHVLLGLQNVPNDGLPFEKYIVRCFTETALPAYLRRNPEATFDLRPLVDEDMILRAKRNITGNREDTREPIYNFSVRSEEARRVKVNNLKTWPAHDLFHLDMSQFRAVQNALSREFSIIQGPPGTGKTYIGLKVVKALLHNRNLWNTNPDTGQEDNRPLLVVCYTNHALDQFLEGILRFFKGDILRLGSRSSSEVMKQLNISNMRMTMRKKRELPRIIHMERMSTKHTMKALQEEINKICERIEMARRELLHEDTLEAAMGKSFTRLVSGFEFRMYQYGYEMHKSKKQSAMLEWLGYGNILTEDPAVEEQQEVQNENNIENDQVNDGNQINNEENQDDLMDEFINVIDELDAEMNMRQLDIEDLENEEENDALVTEMQQALHDLDVRKPVIALNVSQLDADDKKSNLFEQWQMTKKQKKQMKKTLRKELSSNDRMTREEVSRNFDMWELRKQDRWRLYRFWVNAYCDSLKEKIRGKEDEFQVACAKYNEVLMQEDREIMRQSTVIGMTTTCAARYQSVLQEIRPRIVVVEEAAEVLEAHIVSTLSRGCEHVVLIGDHKQLKPSPTVYKLATKYNLEISLFERMICNNMAYDCLQFQHRMRPDISKMLRKIYPELKDDDAVKGYQDVKGISSNVFFIDHTNEETSEDDLKSHSNDHEADYIVALCRYLLLQGYEREQITVLTLYSGQLFALRKRMPKTLYEGVRVTVVDNYQGEENDIILLSLVRSNEDGKIGFLSIENRVCVALSRAKIGLYVIGNFTIMANKSKLWCSIADHARRNMFLGEALPLYCQNHPNENGLLATEPSDFKKAPEGGCMKPCEYRLPCGHTCARACHTYDRDHEEYECNKPCTKILCERNHRCSRRCNQECGKCHEWVDKVLPKCGHTEAVMCYIDPVNWKCTSKCFASLSCGHPCRNLCGEAHTEYCTMKVVKTWSCGHSEKISCYKKRAAICTKKCGQELECGHICKGTCGECFQGRLHMSCSEDCNRPLVCEHPCQDSCSSCPPCIRQCENRCKHSYCGKKCGQLCVPCAELCEWQCRHHRCEKICSEPCERPRCNKPCKKLLECKHQCIGLCGEPCPNLCKICHNDIVTEVFLGSEDEVEARYVQLEDCGHLFESSDLDRWMDMISEGNNDTAIKLKECPRCKTAIRRNLRYGNMIKQALRDIESVKRRMLGDDVRKSQMEKSISRGIPTLPVKEQRIIREYYSDLTKGPFDENTLSAIENQINIVRHVNGLKAKFEKDRDSVHYIELNDKAIEHLDNCHEFTLRKRKYFTVQETNDLNAELDRLQRLRIFLQYKERRRVTESALPRELSLDFMTAEEYLTKGTFTNIRKMFVDKTLETLKTALPLSGLAITDKERIDIVTAIGLGKGHWFKCPNGHVYCIADCGGATVESKCPDCGSVVGGSGHTLRQDNRFAPEMDGASNPAWSEQANMGNYDPFQIRF
ncbi:NFX1-type zinc finger-containing protein 1-like isoform X1 [Mytilus edulis]|uniref:NFX1-type zinc finger-containing protein 1-like isoform X1 n=1 Tax=Mytilus edulis TaxID=6550 RepID=UPI0039EE0BB0